MSRHWKEPYSLAKAQALGIRHLEGGLMIGHRLAPKRTTLRTVNADQSVTYEHVAHTNVLMSLTDSEMRQLNWLPVNEWIYYVSVCGFTFAFFTDEEITYYIQYYSTKILPSRIENTSHYDHDARQSTFNRLPFYLREEPKRVKVVKALQRAQADFQKQEQPAWAS